MSDRGILKFNHIHCLSKDLTLLILTLTPVKSKAYIQPGVFLVALGKMYCVGSISIIFLTKKKNLFFFPFFSFI